MGHVSTTLLLVPPRGRQELMEVWRESLILPGFQDLRDSALDELARYFNISTEDALTRCRNWETDSIREWEAGDRSTKEGILEFYHSTQSWIFDTMWYHAEQYHGDMPAESVMVAEHLADTAPGRHLDFGSGPGSTSLFFRQLGWQVALADISTTMLTFARWRFEQRDADAAFFDLNRQELPAASFDLITACDVMVHVPDARQTLRRLHRALKPGGVLIFNVDARPKRTRETQAHLYRFAYPVLRPVRSVGFQRLAPLQFFHIYRKIEQRPMFWSMAVRFCDIARYNRVNAALGNMYRSLMSVRRRKLMN